MSKATYESHFEDVVRQLNVDIQIANRLIIEDIHSTSKRKTPLADTAQLRGNVQKGKIDNKSSFIQWSQPYASYQERGSRYDGSHVVKHYTTPGTGKDFAKDSVKEVLSKAQKYYDKIGKFGYF